MDDGIGALAYLPYSAEQVRLAPYSSFGVRWGCSVAY